jgi:hypothetical protein
MKHKSFISRSIALLGITILIVSIFITPALASRPDYSAIPVTNDTQLDSSFNWSGYMSQAGVYTGVGGTWTIPQTNNTSNSIGADAAWVGIGGTNSHDLIQAGTMAVSSPDGTTTYEAWYELLPGYSKTIAMKVSPGDSVTTSIVKQAGNTWTISLKNNTNGQSFSKDFSYNSSMSSAEWIVEAPVVGYRFANLNDFNTVNFNDCWSIKDGTKVNLAQSGAHTVTMKNLASQELAVATPVTSDGNGFTLSRTAASSSVAYSGYTRRSFSYSGRGYYSGRYSRSRSYRQYMFNMD